MRTGVKEVSEEQQTREEANQHEQRPTNADAGPPTRTRANGCERKLPIKGQRTRTDAKTGQRIGTQASERRCRSTDTNAGPWM